jgi:hypothetical protein
MKPKPVEKYIIESGRPTLEGGFTIHTDLDITKLQDIPGVNLVSRFVGDEWSISTSKRYSPDEIEQALHEAMQALTGEG